MIEGLQSAIAAIYAALTVVHNAVALGAGVLFDNGDYSPEIFIALTLILGGAGAWASGRALALTWRPLAQVPAYIFPLAAAVRFLHYALYDEALSSILYFVVAFAILISVALLGYRATRAQQMARQYSWAFARHGSFAWRRTV